MVAQPLNHAERLPGALLAPAHRPCLSVTPAARSLVPLVKAAECVVMAGDQCQLPPTVLSREALR